jgi:hypothetical protein
VYYRLTTKKPTGIFWTQSEVNFLGQLQGMVKDSEGKTKATNVFVHNLFLALMGERYEYEWKNVEINPATREVIAVCQGCDETLSENDVTIEE